MTNLPMPLARRLRRPSWRDSRLIVGVLLVLLAVLGTARVVASADDTVPVYAAVRTLVPGQEITQADLIVVPIRLTSDAALYLDGDQPLSPQTYAVREVRAGELVPASALGDRVSASGRTVTVPVDTSTAAGYGAGMVADVWVSRREDDAPGSGRYAEPVLLVAGAGVQGVPAATGGRLSVGADRSAVRLLVASEDVPRVIAAVDQEARITLVPLPGQSLDP